MVETAYWDDEAYIRIDRATYDAHNGELVVYFRNGDEAHLSAWRVLRPGQHAPEWSGMEVVDNYHLHVPTAGPPLEVPGFTIRTLTDSVFAAHLARQAAESARQVGARLKELRKARGFSAREVAERVGMAQQHISRIEQGRHDVSFSTLERILAAMGYTLQDLAPEGALTTAAE